MSTAIYLRHSSEDTGDSIAGQRQLCRDWLQRNGIDQFAEYAEDRTSAYKKRMSERTEWARLESDIRSGKVTHVVARHVDRLTRSMIDLEHLVSLVEATGVRLSTVWSSDLDLNSPAGRQVARIMASIAVGESETKSQRILAAKARARAAGRSTGGGRPFGYQSIDGGLREVEAQLIRDGMNAVLAGVSLHGVFRMFEESGVPTARGGTWHKKTVRDILLRWRNAGRIEHKGEDAGPATYPAIVDLDTLHAVRAMLMDEQRAAAYGTGANGGPKAQTLLTTLIECGKCGSPFKAGTTSSGAGRNLVYKCSGPKCFSSIARAVMDDMAITSMVRFWMSSDVAAYAPDDSTRDELIRLQAEKTALDDERANVAQMLGAGLLKGDEAQTALQGIASRMEAADAALAEVQRRFALASALSAPIVSQGVVNLGQAAALMEHFKGQHLDIQRKQISQVWRIVVYPAQRGRGEGVTERRAIERRAVWECLLNPSLSFDPVLEDLHEAMESVAAQQDSQV